MDGRKSEEKKAVESAMKGMRSFFFYMIADFAIIAGIVLILLGIGEFFSKIIGITGSGQILLGILLFIVGSIVLAKTRTNITIGMQQPAQQQPPMPPVPPPESGSYR